MVTTDITIQQIVDEAVQKALDKYIEKLERWIRDQDRYYTVSQLATYSGFSNSAIRLWITQDNNPLPAIQVGRDYKIRKEDFDKWINQFKVRKERVEKLVDIKSA